MTRSPIELSWTANHPSNEKDYQKNYQKYYQKDHADIDVHDVVGVLRLLDPSRDRSEEHEEQEWLRGDGLQDAVHVLASFKELSQTSY